MRRKKIAVVTGGDGHIGRATCKALKKRGYNIVSWDVIPNKKGLREHPKRIDLYVANAPRSAEEYMQDFSSPNVLSRLAPNAAVVTVASIYGILGPDFRIYEGTEILTTPEQYAAAKGALVQLTRYWATKYAPIRVNCVCPGGIYRDHSIRFEKNYSNRVPLKRMGTEKEVAHAICFLAEATYCTGVILPVDGGLSCW